MPIEAIASTKSTATGMSVNCRGVVISVNGILASGPNGITAQVTKAGTTTKTGAIKKTTLSAALGMRSSFKASFTPSARLCNSPKGPLTLGPMRCCIRPTTRRSNQMLNSVNKTSRTKMSTALRMTTHTESLPNWLSGSVAAGVSSGFTGRLHQSDLPWPRRSR